MDLVILLGLAGVLLVVPARVDRWALKRGASPTTLAALAAVTLAGLAALPIAFVICTTASSAGDDDVLARLTAVAGLLMIGVGAGRALAKVVAVRRRWAALAALARELDLPRTDHGVTVLPVPEVLAFAAGTDAFVSQGLLEHLSESERAAVLAHEREHAVARHARLLAVAGAVSHGLFAARPARAAEAALRREADVLADRAAAAANPGGAAAVAAALRRLADDGGDAAVQHRLRRLEDRSSARLRGNRLAGAVTIGIGVLVISAVCVALRVADPLLAVLACTTALAVFGFLMRPVLAADRA
jgi:Zn-dependent protease with chaperone function